VVAAPLLAAKPEPVATPVSEPASEPETTVDGDEFLVPPGFYPDPDGGARRRWWDGAKWTARRAA
jgi:hypothetical protein